MARGQRASIIAILSGKKSKDYQGSKPALSAEELSEHGVMPDDASDFGGYEGAALTPTKKPRSGRRGSLLGMFGGKKSTSDNENKSSGEPSQNHGASNSDHAAAYYGYGDGEPTVNPPQDSAPEISRGRKKSSEAEAKSSREPSNGVAADYGYEEASTTRLSSTEQLYSEKRKLLRARRMSMTPMEQRTQRATERRNKLLLSKMMTEEASEESDLIQQRLGVDDKGMCLRHPNQTICGKVQEHRFEKIHTCRICGSEQKAGGARQRKSMVGVIDALKSMQQDKKKWREKTKIMHNGRVDDTDDESLNGSNSKIDASDKSLDSLDEVFAFCNNMDEGDGNADEDTMWKEEVTLRVAQVRVWDAKAALKCDPVYAKYFRMLDLGIPFEAVKQGCEMDGWDSRIIDLDPTRPLKDQLAGSFIMTEPEKEDLLWNLKYAMGQDNDETQGSQGSVYGIAETVDLVHEAYCKKKGVLDKQRRKERNKEDSQKWIGQGKELLRKSQAELPPSPQPVPSPESDDASEKIVFTKDDVEALHLSLDLTNLPIIGEMDEDEDEDTEAVSDNARLSGDNTEESITSTPQRRVSIDSTFSIDSEMTYGSERKKKKKRKSKLKTTSKRRSSKLSAASSTSELVTTQRMLTEKDIVMSSLIAQVENLQRQVSEKKSESSEPRLEADLASELDATKRMLVEKEVIASSLVAHVQSLQSQLTENARIIEAQRKEIPNLRSQLEAKDKVIKAQNRVLDVLKNSMTNGPSTSSTAASTTSIVGDVEEPMREMKELDQLDAEARALQSTIADIEPREIETELIRVNLSTPSNQLPVSDTPAPDNRPTLSLPTKTSATNQDVIAELAAHLNSNSTNSKPVDDPIPMIPIVNESIPTIGDDLSTSPIEKAEGKNEPIAIIRENENPIVSTEDIIEVDNQVPKSKKKTRSSVLSTGAGKPISPHKNEVEEATTDEPSSGRLDIPSPIDSDEPARSPQIDTQDAPEPGHESAPVVRIEDVLEVDTQVAPKLKKKKRSIIRENENPIVSTEDIIEVDNQVPKSKKKTRSSIISTGVGKAASPHKNEAEEAITNEPSSGSLDISSPIDSDEPARSPQIDTQDVPEPGHESVSIVRTEDVLEVNKKVASKPKKKKRATVPALSDKPHRNQKVGTPSNDGSTPIPIVSEKDIADVDKQVTRKSSKKKRVSSKDKKKSGKVKEKSRTGKSKKPKSKKKKEPNLDKAYLRKTFQECVNKLIVINRSFGEKVSEELTRESSCDRKSMRRSSMRIDSWKAPAEWNDYFSDDDEDLDTVPPLAPPMPQFNPSPPATRPTLPKSVNSEMNLVVTAPRPKMRKTASLVLSPRATSKRSSNKSIRWGNEDGICQVIYVEKHPESLKKDLYYSKDEMKFFRFEKFMDDNGEEFEIVEESEDEEYEEYEEEEYEDGDYSIEEEIMEESVYDEESIVSATSYLEEEIFTDDEFSEEEILPERKSRRQSIF